MSHGLTRPETAARYIFNPVEIRGVVYVLAKNSSIVALDATTGKEIWVHENARGPLTTHGINYWESADGRDRRLLFSNANHLEAIDAATGRFISSFGANGRVDLREGLGRDPATISVQSALPGRVFENLIILGSATNQEYDSAPGDIRAFDVRSGSSGLDLPHHPACGRVRLRHLAEGRMENSGRRECLGRAVAR